MAAAPAAPQERLTFIGVALDLETRQADRVLRDFLHRKGGVEFAPEELEYGHVIDRLANWRPEEGHYLARTTPYVYVTAEMLGADFENLGTYVSATTGRRTYSSYFVVHRGDFAVQPDLDDLLRFLEQRSSPEIFVYHSKFSTSSYFLPSLFFRSHNIFHMPESTESLVAIHSKPISKNSSTELVKLVATRQAALAAVWDGTKAKFEEGHPAGLYEEFGSKVFFIGLPNALPNDLLVCSSSLDPEIKERLRTAIRSMAPEEIGQGDFKSWQPVREATDVRVALADLRWLAREQTTPVTVEVQFRDEAGIDSRSTALLEATRQAVRLSGSEFVLFDPDFHEHIDFRWTLEPIHDGAIILRSAIPGSGTRDQVFEMSFRDMDGLTRRIDSIIHSRVHRIRYVWPYSDNPPIVIRDTAAAIPVGATVKVQKVTWLDPQKNKFRAGPLFDAKIRASGFYKYELSSDDFPDFGNRELDFDAMSNVRYRVILANPSEENPLFRTLTVVLVALLTLAAVAAGLDLLRKPREAQPTLR